MLALSSAHNNCKQSLVQLLSQDAIETVSGRGLEWTDVYSHTGVLWKGTLLHTPTHTHTFDYLKVTYIVHMHADTLVQSSEYRLPDSM